MAVATTFFLLDRRGLDEGPLSLCPLLSESTGEGGAAGDLQRGECAPSGQRGTHAERKDRVLPWKVTAVRRGDSTCVLGLL